MNFKSYLSSLSLLMVMFYAQPLWASTSAREIAAIGKIMSLSKSTPAGETTFAVVYDPSSKESTEDLQSIEAILGEGYRAPKHIFKFKKVAIEDLGKESFPILFMSAGLNEATQKNILTNGVQHSSLTITTTLPYVEKGNCVLGVDVGNAVSILLNSEAYNSSKLKFDGAFKFMIKEI